MSSGSPLTAFFQVNSKHKQIIFNNHELNIYKTIKEQRKCKLHILWIWGDDRWEVHCYVSSPPISYNQLLILQAASSLNLHNLK